MEHAGAKQLVVQAQLIDEVEATASALNIATSFLRLNRPDGHPDYVHVLRIHPDKLDPVGLGGHCPQGRGSALKEAVQAQPD